MVYRTDWFAEIKKSSYPWDKSHLISVYDPFNVLLELFCYFLNFNIHKTEKKEQILVTNNEQKTNTNSS